MEFDISYLLFLQNIRESTGGVFDEFFNALSKFAVDILPFLGYIIFWSVSKKWGYRFMITLWCGEVINGLLKLIVCAYRPWIRSDKINPAGDSKVAATGYSFPSGHSTVATIHYGTIFAWQRKKRMWLAIVCAVLLFLTCFSRNYLGVHTPQDVLVGFGVSVVLIIVVGFSQKKLEGNQKAVDILTFAGIAAVLGVLIFVMFKPYPMDYDASGVLLVDPQDMIRGGYEAIGGFLGILLGSYVETKYICFRIEGLLKEQKIKRAVAGSIVVFLLLGIGKAILPGLLGIMPGSLLGRFIPYFTASAVYPLCFMRKGDQEK